MKISMKIYPEKRKKSKKNGLIPMYIRLIHKGKKSEGRLNNIEPINEDQIKYWHQDTEQFSKGLDDTNEDVAKLKKRFREFNRNKSKYRHLNVKQIKEQILDDNQDIRLSLIDEMEKYYQSQIEGRSEYAKGTIQNKRKAINHLKKYLITHKIVSCAIEEFEKLQVQKFIDYLLNGDNKSNFNGMKRVSAAAIHKELKTIFNGFIDLEIIDKSPFNVTGVKFKRDSQPFLTESEFRRIIFLDLSYSTKLSVYKDIFLFLCYTGISYIDLLNLKPRDVQDYKLNITRTKTGIVTRQHLTESACEIVQRYKDHLDSNVNGSVLPKKSLDKMNLNLKVIGAKAGFSVELSTKFARRFFRQSLNNANINERLLVRSMMGHSIASEIDAHYLHINEKMLKEAKEKLDEYFNDFLDHQDDI